MIQMLEFLDKDIKMVAIPLLHIFQKLEERLFLLSREVKDRNRTEIKTIIPEVENTLTD